MGDRVSQWRQWIDGKFKSTQNPPTEKNTYNLDIIRQKKNRDLGQDQKAMLAGGKIKLSLLTNRLGPPVCSGRAFYFGIFLYLCQTA